MVNRLAALALTSYLIEMQIFGLIPELTESEILVEVSKLGCSCLTTYYGPNLSLRNCSLYHPSLYLGTKDVQSTVGTQ